jgi:tRNA threonylcarbamoyladenosine biosynthesis protein TsaE
VDAGSFTIHSVTPEQTFLAGQELGARLSRDYPRGAVVLLVGPLGAGKTVIAKGIAQGLGIEELVSSPTYTIISEYRSERITLHHVDLYRVEGTEQLENLGLEDLLGGSGYVLVEWGEKIEGWLASPGAEPHLRLTLSFAPDGGRDLVVEGG